MVSIPKLVSHQQCGADKTAANKAAVNEAAAKDETLYSNVVLFCALDHHHVSRGFLSL